MPGILSDCLKTRIWHIPNRTGEKSPVDIMLFWLLKRGQTAQDRKISTGGFAPILFGMCHWLPKYLFISLSWRQGVGGTIRRTKRNDKCDFPRELNILCGDIDINYEFKSAIVHKGNSVRSGHYTCFVPCDGIDMFIERNDNNLGDPCSFVDMKKMIVGWDGRRRRDCVGTAYCFLYTRKE